MHLYQPDQSQSDVDDTTAALMLEAVAVILSDRGEVDLYDDLDEIGGAAAITARAALALEFNKRPKALQLRAMMEGWDLQRITREMY